jgi:raffinose/stachyose/melibiose transport system permease protein
MQAGITGSAPVQRPASRRPSRRRGQARSGGGFGGFRSALPFLAGGLILYVIFLIYPVIESVGLSFYHWDGVGPKTFAGLWNYRELFTSDEIFSTALLNTVVWTALSVVVPNLLALGLAVALNGKVRGRVALRAAFYMPAVMATIIVAMTWNLVYDPSVGLFSNLLRAVGLGAFVRPWLGDPAVVIFAVFIASVWQSTGIGMVLFLGGLQSVRTDLIDASRVDGAGRWVVFRHVELPALRPTTIVVLMLSVVNALKGFDLIYAMTQGGPADSSEVLGLYGWASSVTSRQFGIGSAVATVLLLMTMVAIIPYIRWAFKEMGNQW